MSARQPTPGITVRHRKSCPGPRADGRCCTPSFQAHVFDRRSGRRIRKTFESKSAAKLWRQDALVALREGRIRATPGQRLDEAARGWLDGARAGQVLNRSGDRYKPSAIRAYDQNLRLRVLPALGDRRLSELRRTDLQALVDRLVSEGASPATVMTTMLPLRAIFRRAVSRGDLDVNPTTGLEMPAVRSRRARIASPADAERLLDALDPRDRPLWATALYAGLRRGELTALRWSDVDLAAGTIRVQRGWDAVEGEIAPKSREGRRTVPIPAVLRDHLLEHRMRQEDPTGQVFGGPYAVRAALDRAARVRRERDDLTAIGLHEARHTYASFMIAAGVNAKSLSTYMGHANIAITLDLYGHLLPGSEDKAAAMLDAFLARSAGGTNPAPTVAPTVARTTQSRS